MTLTAAERVLLHLHGQLNAREPGRESTQAGIADGAQVLRSHVPRTVKVLVEEGLVESRGARLLGHARRTDGHALTPPGVARAREILGSVEARAVEGDGRRTTLGGGRGALGVGPGGGSYSNLALPTNERGEELGGRGQHKKKRQRT